MRAAGSIAACVLGALVSAPMHSQAQPTPPQAEECAETDTIESCWKSFFGEDATREKAAEAADQVAATVAPEVAEKSTGVGSGGTSLASTTEDFIPLLTFVGLVSESNATSSDGVVAFDVNPPLGGSKKPGLKIRLLVATDPQVSDDVKMALPEATRDAQAETLQKGLSDTDNYALSLTWNLRKSGFGRDFERYRDDFAKLATTVQEPLTAGAAMAANLKLGQTIQEAMQYPGFDLTKPFKQDALDAAQQLALRRAVEEAAKAIAVKDEVRTQALQDAGLGKFAALVANQPQLHFAAKWQSRDPLTGGDEVSAKATFEWSKVNLKNALSDSSCDRGAAAFSAACTAAYKEYVGEHAASMETAARFAFSGEYVDIDSRTLDLTALDLGSVTLPGAKKLVLTAAGSRNWGKGGGLGEPIRVDFEAKYEDVSDDPMRQNRGVASLTLNKKIAGMSIPLGIVYANRPEFITDVDDRLTTHLGLKFDFWSKPDG